MRPKEANERSKADFKESKHGRQLYQKAGDTMAAMFFKVDRNCGERQPHPWPPRPNFEEQSRIMGSPDLFNLATRAAMSTLVETA